MKRGQRRIQKLTEAEIDRIAEGVVGVLGTKLAERAQSRGVNLADTIRLNVLGAACAAARQKKNLTLKEAASAIEAPQYRVRAIERGHLREIDPEVLRDYVGFLGLVAEVAGWARQHRRLATSLGLLPRSRSRRKSFT